MKQSTRRRLAYGSNATLVTVMFVAVLVLLYWLASTYRTRWDLTEGASNTLQGETLHKIALIDAERLPVEITALLPSVAKMTPISRIEPPRICFGNWATHLKAW